MQLDASGTLLWFQLAHTVWPHGGERIAEWRRGAGLRVGTIHDDAGGHYRNMSPLIHYAAELDPAVVTDLVDYFLSHADVLDATLRESVAEAIWQSTQDGGA